jgi:two-component system, LuxR family, response regulator FixJ
VNFPKLRYVLARQKIFTFQWSSRKKRVFFSWQDGEALMSKNKSTALVYVVDDEFAIRDSLTMLIESTGQCVRSFESAEAFLNGYDPGQPGCLILDIKMPSMNGIELQEELTKRAITVPIIFISGNQEIIDSAQAFRKGAVDFLEKPFSNSILLARIEEALLIDKNIRASANEKRELQNCVDHLILRDKALFCLILKKHANKQFVKVLDSNYHCF